MNKKTRSTKSEKWRHTCNSVEIAWTNEQKVAVTSYGRTKKSWWRNKKNQEKANNSPSYRCAAIKKLVLLYLIKAKITTHFSKNLKTERKNFAKFLTFRNFSQWKQTLIYTIKTIN